MQYFITGASGFIGKRLVKKLLEREGSVVHFLIREVEKDSLEHLYEYWVRSPITGLARLASQPQYS